MTHRALPGVSTYHETMLRACVMSETRRLTTRFCRRLMTRQPASSDAPSEQRASPCMRRRGCRWARASAGWRPRRAPGRSGIAVLACAERRAAWRRLPFPRRRRAKLRRSRCWRRAVSRALFPRRSPCRCRRWTLWRSLGAPHRRRRAPRRVSATLTRRLCPVAAAPRPPSRQRRPPPPPRRPRPCRRQPGRGSFRRSPRAFAACCCSTCSPCSSGGASLPP